MTLGVALRRVFPLVVLLSVFALLTGCSADPTEPDLPPDPTTISGDGPGGGSGDVGAVCEDGPTLTLSVGFLDFSIDSSGRVAVGGHAGVEASLLGVKLGATVDYKHQLRGRCDDSIVVIRHPDGASADLFRVRSGKELAFAASCGAVSGHWRPADHVLELSLRERSSRVVVVEGSRKPPVPRCEPVRDDQAAPAPARSADPVQSGCAFSGAVVTAGATVTDSYGNVLMAMRIVHSDACNRDWADGFSYVPATMLLTLPSDPAVRVCLPQNCQYSNGPFPLTPTSMVVGNVMTSACALAVSPVDNRPYRQCISA